MLVKSPHKKKDTKQNRRKVTSNKKESSATSNHNRSKKKGLSFSVPRVAPWNIIVGVIVLGLVGMLYLGNVFATQQLLAKVQKKQQQYNQAQRSYDNYRLEYDRMIGPSEIYSKAKARGFINGGPAEKVIEVKND